MDFAFHSVWFTRLLSFLFIFPLISSVAYADLSSCSGNFQENGSNSRGVKIKSLCTSYESTWTVIDDNITLPGESTGNFCLIAYQGADSASNCNTRDMEDAAISVTGDTNSSGHFVLGGEIPVTIALRNHQSNSLTPFQPDTRVLLPAIPNKCVCRDYQYSLEVTVTKTDILNSGSTAVDFEGKFYLHGFHTTAGLQGSIPFTVKLQLEPAIQISGLEDMNLNNSNEQQFCVFAIGAETFSLSARSNGGTKNHFRLINGSSKQRYSMTVRDKASLRETYKGNNHSTKSGWQPSHQYTCNGHTAENMKLTIDLYGNSQTTGTFSDTMTLTVTPD
ncbi:hypothetical protein [Endozoicomonas elysicola]|uniref:Spore coat protein U domain-containing protein n=1 Tax=Endozoicomonas elysicola TaxID=305900 RepID=A0A081K7E4_9GAMM|nr:hypothetical protein [Endozoicomonas elysicola]KEI70070.1 hypothetical protein GV64_04310 [Endozoicomonas elysicola]